jgi:hypothetical protein
MNSIIHYPRSLHQTQRPSKSGYAPDDKQVWSHRVMERLAHNLEYLTGLDPQQDQVTFILGHGECPTNHLALVAWLHEQLDESPVEMDRALSLTFTALQSTLSQEVYS